MTTVIDDQRDAGLRGRLCDVVDDLADVLDTFRPELVQGEVAAEMTRLFIRAERLAAYGKALAAARSADIGIWREAGARSAGEWLGREGGTSTGQAAMAIATARRVQDQPEVEAALRSGALSAAQGMEIASAVEEAPTSASRLLDLAGRGSTAQLREECQRIRAEACPDPVARDRRIHAGRYLRTWIDHEGAGCLGARMTKRDLGRLLAVLDPYQDAQFDAARREGRKERIHAYALDGLLAMAGAAAGAPGDLVAQAAPPPLCRLPRPTIGATARRKGPPGRAGELGKRGAARVSWTSRRRSPARRAIRPTPVTRDRRPRRRTHR